MNHSPLTHRASVVCSQRATSLHVDCATSNRAYLVATGLALVIALATACGSKGSESDGSTTGASGTGNGGGPGGYVISGSGGAGQSTTSSSTAQIPAGCVVGSQGCTCDSLDTCSSGLVCKSGVCCNSSNGDCAATNTTTVSTATATNTSTTANANSVCTPGVVGPVIADCGYPYASSNPLTNIVFNENEVLAAIVPTGGSLATVRVFYGDEHALTLGVSSVTVNSASGSTTTTYPVTPLATDPGAVTYPQTGSNVLVGDQAGLDPSARPMWPALFITDITNDPNNRAGDWQQGGRPYNPNAIFGTWKAAARTIDATVTPHVATITPAADPAKNVWNLGAGADAVPTSLKKNEGYGAEVVWQLALIPGHSYRVQAMVHDGDQNKVGGDCGEACVVYCAGGNDFQDGGTPPPPPNQYADCGELGTPCGTGGLAANECAAGSVCANGCCIDTGTIN